MNKQYKCICNRGLSPNKAQHKQHTFKLKTITVLLGFVGGIAPPYALADFTGDGGSTFLNCSTTNNGVTRVLGSGARSSNSTAINLGACAPQTDAISIGRDATTQGAGNMQSVALGADARATGDQSIALGSNTRATGNSSIAIGGDDIDKMRANPTIMSRLNTLTGANLSTTGYRNTAASDGSTTVGVQAVATGELSSAFGLSAEARGDMSSAIGLSAIATGGASTAIGAVAKAAGDGATAIGVNASADGLNSIAIGSNNTLATATKATLQNSVALGSAATASVINAVALGANSVAATAANITGYDPLTGQASVQTGAVWTSTLAAVSVGDASKALTRQITGLAAGTADTDATNVAQLKQVRSYASNIATTTANALGGGSTVDSNGNLTAPSYSVGGSTVSNVGAAITNLDGRTTTNSNNIATNSTAISNISTALSQGTFSVSANGTGATKVVQNAVIDYSNKDNNLKISQSGTNFIFDLADQLNVKTGVTVGNAALSTTGLVISGGPSMTTTGFNAANTKLTNLSAGTVSVASTEGINGSQLYNANQNIASALGGGSIVDGNGNITEPTYSIGGTTVNNVGAAVSLLDGRTTTNSNNIATNTTAISNISTALSQGTFSVSANGTGATKVAQNAVIDYSNKDNNLKISQSGTNFIFDLADQLNVKTGVTVGNAALSTTGLVISGGPSMTTTGFNAANTKLTNLSAGTVSVASTEGINGSQLYNANQNIASALGGGSTVDGNGNITEPTYSIGGTTVNNVGAAVSNLDGRTTTNSTAISNISTALSQGAFSVSANGTGATKVVQNAVIDYSNKDNNLKISQSGTNFIFDLADQLNVKTGVTVGNAALTTTGLVITGGPSMTTTGFNAANTKLTNLSAGTVSAASTEGINGSQLYNANQNIATALGGGSSVDSNGNLTAPSYSVGGSTVNNVGAAVSNLDGRTTTNSNNIATNTTAISNISTALSQGTFSVSANGTGATKVVQNAVIDNSNKDNNLKISQSGTNFIFDLADQLNVKTGVTVGNAALSTTGLVITGGPSMTTTGINAANTKLNNLSAGTVSVASTEGINGSQLYKANQNIASALGGGSTVDGNGNITEPTYSIGGTTVNNVGAAVSLLDGRTTTNSNNIATNTTAISNISTALSQGTFSVSANGTGATKVAQNAVIDYSNKDNNLKISQSGTNFIFDLADQLNVKTGVTVGNAALTTTGLVITGGPSMTTTGINAANTKLTNLSAGTISVASTEGINGSQLYNANQNIATALGGGSSVDSNGNLTAPSYSVGGSTVNNVGAAVSNLDGRTTTNSNNIATNTTAISNISTALSQGAFSVSANGTGATKVAQNAVIDYSNKDNNLKISQSGTNFIFDLADQLNVKTGVTVGNAALSTTGLVISGGPSMTTTGINAVNTKITNLSAGTVSVASTEGINGSQLYNTNQNIASALGGGSSVDSNGNLTAPSYSVGGSTVNNVGAAVSNLDGRTTTNSTAISNISTALSQGAFSVSANGTGATKVAQNAVIDYSNKDNNLKISQSGTNFIFDLADQLNVKTGVTVGNAALTTTGVVITGGPSMTTTGINAANTKITNLSAGTVSAASTEGINGSQLYNANQNIATALGGGSSVDSNGNLTAPSYSVGGSTVNNVGAAITNLDGRTTTNSNNIATNTTAISNISTALSQGTFSVSANGTGATKVVQNAVIDYSNKDNNLKISQSGTNFIFDLADQLNVKTGVTVGNAALSTTGLVISGGPSMTTTGINAANTKLTNLSAGTVSAASTEGINGSQLYNANQNIAAALGGGSSVDSNGNLTAPSYSVGGSTVNNVGAAISSVDGRLNTIQNNVNNIVANTTDAITYARNTAGQIDRSKVNLAGVQSRIAQDKYNNSVVTSGGTLISNVANAVNAADAVNKGQLDSGLSNAKDYTDQQISNVTGGLNLNLNQIKGNVSNLQNGRDGMFQVNPTGTIVMPTPVGENALAGGNAAQASAKNSAAIGNQAVASADQALALGHQSNASADRSVALGYNAIASAKNAVALGTDAVADRENSVSVGSHTVQRQITHVAAGTENTDAVNVQQLNQVSSRIGGKVEQLNQQIHQLNQNVVQVDRRASAAIAGISAMANIPQVFVGGQRSIGVGVGHHRGQNAVAIGASMAVDSGKWVIKGSAAFNSQDKSTFGAGLSRVW